VASDAPNPDHLKARFTAEIPPSGLPARFGIVTAYNPRSVLAPPDVNERADAELERALAGAGLPHFRVTGGAGDGSHLEPGYGIEAESPEAVRPISRRFHQEAFFWVEDGMVFVIDTEGRTRHRVGLWARRLAR
jgi:hypothetical protein